MNTKYIHETIVKDIIDVLQDVKDSDEVTYAINKKNGTSFKSISSKAEALTMVFPFIVSKNADVESAAMACKAQERKCVNLLQMLFSAANITNAKNGEEFVKQFHTNLGTGRMSVDSFMSAMDNFVDENCLITESNDYEYYKAIQKDLSSMNVYFEMDSISESSIADFKVSSVTGDILAPITEAKKNKYRTGFRFNGSQKIDFDASDDDWKGIERQINYYQKQAQMFNQGVKAEQDDKNKEKSLGYEKQKADNDSTSTYYNIYDKERSAKQKEDEFEYRKAQDQIRNAQAEREYELQRQKAAQDLFKLQNDISRNRLVDQDVKKSNELTPTLMTVNFCSTNNEGYAVYSTAIIGVKCKMYAVDGQDIMDRLKSKMKNGNIMLNLVRASTREISFFRDFIFAIDQAKIDAIAQSRRGSSSKMWKILERRALKSKIRRNLAMRNDATAISTLCVTADEVEFFKKTEYIDLEDPRVIRPIMEAYNLMSFIILDDNNEVGKFIYDTGEDEYELVTYNHLERESKDNSKKILNLMSKMNR